MALLEISVVPVGTESPSISSFIAEACREARQKGVKFDVTPTSTVMEGELPALINVAHRMHEAAFKGRTQRVVTNISIDERRDKDLTMEHAVSAVRGELQ